ncbi:hypothetical protein BDY21DRAFT_57914 [Lineolata rhizophorae]|uniref:Uncharacterized protein n=1 Tax=Lineolata rhizophorae TaxID=578093 RepID=A0A6A6NXF3_9PEZI|nr:hypothetical protein BDY21DRAFT_57914 [Lineolata rhizophorae]
MNEWRPEQGPRKPFGTPSGRAGIQNQPWQAYQGRRIARSRTTRAPRSGSNHRPSIAGDPPGFKRASAQQSWGGRNWTHNARAAILIASANPGGEHSVPISLPSLQRRCKSIIRTYSIVWPGGSDYTRLLLTYLASLPGSNCFLFCEPMYPSTITQVTSLAYYPTLPSPFPPLPKPKECHLSLHLTDDRLRVQGHQFSWCLRKQSSGDRPVQFRNQRMMRPHSKRKQQVCDPGNREKTSLFFSPFICRLQVEIVFLVFSFFG